MAEYWKNGQKYIIPDLTPEEEAAIKKDAVKAQQEERKRPLSLVEISELFIKQQINILDVDDNTALRMVSYYPEWAANISFASGDKAQYGGKLYRALQAHTSQEGWQPTVVASLWEEINETFSGTLEEPIPYSGNMALENGKYYVENYVIYKCIRDTINPVYNPLAELVDLYVEIV